MIDIKALLWDGSRADASQSPSRGVPERRVLALVALLVAVPQLVLLRVGGDRQPITEIALQSGLIAYLTLLAAALLVCFAWRVTREDAAGWIAAGMGVAAVQGVALQTRALADAESLADGEEWLLVVHTLLTISIGLIILAARRRALVFDPIALGVLGGAGFALVRWWLVESAVPLHLPDPVVVALLVFLGLTCAGLILAVMAIATMPLWVRVRVAGVATLLSVGYLISFPVPEGTIRSAVAIGAHLLAAVLVGSTGFAMLRAAVREERELLSGLREQLERLDSMTRIDRARLHEVGATIGAIQSASSLLESGQSIQPGKRSRLAAMVRAEIDRLGRLLAARPAPQVSAVDVDAAIEPVVICKAAQGVPVRWTPSGLSALARPDELAEAVSILLENAARHAPGSVVVVGAREAGDVVEISVADSGPGVPSDVAEKLFDWGYAGPGSEGQGLGLAIARQLLEDVGGYLRHEQVAPGAHFVLGVRRAEGGAQGTR